MRAKVKRILLFLLALGSLVGAGSTLNDLQAMRSKYDLASEPAKGISPELALATQVLGWGRGILIDVLWIRMDTLKEQDRYFELVQLAKWACDLAPRFPQVWDFQAWNLAYNVSCRVSSLPDRWAWVWSGVELLRDRGIPLNPNAFRLYESLSWIIWHKIGEQDDNAHFFYKQEFAVMMHRVLGGGGERPVLEKLAAAPATREELLEEPDVRRLVDLCAATGFDLVSGFLELLAGRQGLPASAVEIAMRPENRQAMDKVESFARARVLEDEYKLDPARMLGVMDKYGPFDWRSPYPHAIYWATLGLERLEQFEKRFYGTRKEFGLEIPLAHRKGEEVMFPEDEPLYEWHRVQFTRLIYASMQSLVARGRVVYDRYGRVMADMGTDYRFADATAKLYDDAVNRFGIRFARAMKDGYVNFLARGVIEFYFMGRPDKSRQYYDTLKQKFESEVYGMPFDDYVEWRLRDYGSMLSFSDARVVERAYATQYYFSIGCNADDKAQVLEGEAKLVAEHFNKDAEGALRDMVRYEEIKESVLVDLLSGKLGFPAEILANLKDRLEEVKPGVVARITAQVQSAQQGGLGKEEVSRELKTDSTGIFRQDADNIQPENTAK
jgi:hypothetical protein